MYNIIIIPISDMDNKIQLKLNHTFEWVCIKEYSTLCGLAGAGGICQVSEWICWNDSCLRDQPDRQPDPLGGPVISYHQPATCNYYTAAARVRATFYFTRTVIN